MSVEAIKIAGVVSEYKNQIKNPRVLTEEAEIEGLPILSANKPAEGIRRFRHVLDRMTLDYIGNDGLWLGDRLAGKAIYPVLRVIHKLSDGRPGEFNNVIIGEVFHGAVHPLVLIPRDVVVDCLKGQP